MASYVAAYRVGMLISTAGVLYVVSGFEMGWAPASMPPGRSAIW